jgi:hypothetical protein
MKVNQHFLCLPLNELINKRVERPTCWVCCTSNLAFCLSAVSSICRSVILLSSTIRLPSLFQVTTGTKMDLFSFLSSLVLSSAREEAALARSRLRSVLAIRSDWSPSLPRVVRAVSSASRAIRRAFLNDTTECG